LHILAVAFYVDGNLIAGAVLTQRFVEIVEAGDFCVAEFDDDVAALEAADFGWAALGDARDCVAAGGFDAEIGDVAEIRAVYDALAMAA
jgi:hypothetical protein